MDLSFSPDWPAWICYLIVLLFGLLTGWREIVEKLSESAGVWRRPSTWVLIFLLGIGPVALFWVLDRVGALHDTSAIAAAIVGVAYSQILKGDSGYKAPGSTSPIWNFLSWWRDRVAKTVQDRAANNVLAFDQVVCERIVAGNSLDNAVALALKLSSDPVALQTRFVATRTAFAAADPPIAPAIVDYKIAESAYKEIRADPGFRELMILHGLIDKTVVDAFFTPPWSLRAKALLAAGVFVALVIAGIIADRSGIARWAEREYLIARLAKASGTVNDVDRVTARLIDVVSSTQAGTAEFWLRPLLGVLHDSTLPMGRVDAILRIFLTSRDGNIAARQGLAERLVPVLRNSNVDARRRVQLALIYLTEGAASEAPNQDEVLKWNPTEGDSVVSVEHKIDVWRAYWSKIKKP